MRKISITDVARRAGVSTATASYALSGNGRVAARTREKVIKAADELGFIRDEAAVRLRTGRSNLIGVVINDIDNPFFNELVGEFESAAWGQGYLTILCTSQDDPERQKRLVSSLISQGVAGVVISPVQGSGVEDLEPLRARDIPYTVCVRDINDPGSDFVGADDFEAGLLAAQYVLDRGHRKLCFVGGYEHTATWRRRRKGIQAAIDGLGAEPVRLMEHTGDEGPAFGRDVVGRMLAQADRSTAVIGFNDATAIGAYLAAGPSGFQIGKDLSVVGMDNIPQADLVLPGLTTVELFPRRMGAECANALIGRFAGAEQARRKVLMTPTLIERGSVARV